MGTGLTLIVLFITIHCICPYPLIDQENDATDTTPQCPLGFTFDNVKKKCKLEWNIAGRSNGIENLTIKCPIDLDFDVTYYSDSTICVFGFDIDPSDGDCHLTKKIAGKVDLASVNLFIICPLGYIYTGSGKLCKKADRRYIIDAPIICSNGARPDPKGECRDVW